MDKKHFLFFASLGVAFFLTALPLPAWTVWLKPSWIMLVLIYWLIVAPEYCHVSVFWIIGLFIDGLSGSVFGAHALAIIVVTYFVAKFMQRFLLYPWVQQMLWISAFIGVYQGILFLIQGIIGELPLTLGYWLPVITSALLWPWIYLLLNGLQERTA